MLRTCYARKGKVGWQLIAFHLAAQCFWFGKVPSFKSVSFSQVELGFQSGFFVSVLFLRKFEFSLKR
jgi:hypothetical protein